MVKLLSIISLILALVLFPPAALALVSNNAVPGDATYPIKRALEDGIFAVASLNSVSRAWFAAARSNRRFKEFTALIAQGKKGGETLNELVEQTQVAASQIAQVNDEGQKQKLIQQLSESIKKYDQGLQNLSPSTTPQETPNPTPAQVRPTVPPQPGQTSAPVVQPRPTLTSQPTPAPTTTSTSTPTPHPTPAPTPAPADADRQRQIDEARRQLEEIRRKLAEEQRLQTQEKQLNSTEQKEQESNDKKEDKKEKKEDKVERKQEQRSLHRRP